MSVTDRLRDIEEQHSATDTLRDIQEERRSIGHADSTKEYSSGPSSNAEATYTSPAHNAKDHAKFTRAGAQCGVCSAWRRPCPNCWASPIRMVTEAQVDASLEAQPGRLFHVYPTQASETPRYVEALGCGKRPLFPARRVPVVEFLNGFWIGSDNALHAIT